MSIILLSMCEGFTQHNELYFWRYVAFFFRLALCKIALILLAKGITPVWVRVLVKI